MPIALFYNPIYTDFCGVFYWVLYYCSYPYFYPYPFLQLYYCCFQQLSHFSFLYYKPFALPPSLNSRLPQEIKHSVSYQSNYTCLKGLVVIQKGTVSLRWKVMVLSVCLSVGRSVSQSVVISRKAVSNKRRKECILVGS